MGNFNDERDPLTGLLTMNGFFDAVQKRREAGLDMAYRINGRIIYFNLTDFKYFNASHGIEKGNEILLTLARILLEEFPSFDVARFSDDHYVVYASLVDVRDRIMRVNERLLAHTENGGIHLKAGIRNCPEEAMNDNALSILCDQAKIACDSIKYDLGQIYAVYSEELNRNIAMRNYITEHIREAVEQGQIHVYYQPVVRTLTGKLCGFEALARWVDPKFGIIAPATFVPILENARLVDVLDSFVIDEVARTIKNQLSVGSAVPISFNLSRLDFVTTKPYEIVEEAVLKYGIPREYLRVEITESTLIEDPELVRASIDRFHQSGYQVWMDDFGSGYSSLSILHNYQFDEIKIDLMFLRNFTTEARAIVTSVIDAAKHIGIHTLAEGVETLEQVEFLTNAGCEKIQGYYYGQPQEMEDILQHCENYGMEMESRMESHIFDKVGKLDLTTDTPMVLIYHTGEQAVPLYATENFKKIIRKAGISSLYQLKMDIEQDPFGTAARSRTLAERAIATGVEEAMSFARNGRYFRMGIEILAGNRNMAVLKVVLTDITMGRKDESLVRFDRILRNAVSLFTQVYTMDFHKNELHVISSTGVWDRTGDVFPDLDRRGREFADRAIYPADRRRFLEFMAWDTMSDRISASVKGFLINSFRVLQQDGNYEWRDFTIQLLSTDEAADVVVFVRESILESIEKREIKAVIPRENADSVIYASDGSVLCTTEELWNSFMDSSGLRMFWKDKERRFVGVNKAFLEAYDLASEKKLIGKNDEDMGWHVVDEPYKNAEQTVIDNGVTIKNEIGQCLIRGRNHIISATKFPVYHEGKIAGLMGYFVDTEEVEQQHDEWMKVHMTDPVTGFMSERATLETVFRFYENYRRKGTDFILAILKVPQYEDFSRTYGMDAGDHLLQKIAEVIREEFTIGTAIANFGSGRFCMMDKNMDLARMRNHLQEAENKIHRILEVDGYRCTLFAHYALIQASETRDLTEMQQMISIRLREAIEMDNTPEMYTGDRVQFDREKYDNSEECVYMSDLKTYDLIYMNASALKASGFPENYDYRGKKCYEIRRKSDKPCENCSNPVLRRDRFYTREYHSTLNGNDYIMRDTLVPWRGRNVRFSGAMEITGMIQRTNSERNLMHNEVGVNDAITVALREEDPDRGILSVLAKIVQEVGAEHAFVFEENSDGSALRTYHYPGQDSSWLLTPDEMSYFAETFSTKLVAVIRSKEELKDLRFHAYSRLTKRGVNNYVAVEILHRGERIGFVGVDNVPDDGFEKAETVLRTLSRIVAILIRNREMMRSYNELSRRDSLTGTLNRRAFIEAAERMDVDGSTAIIYGDINGLKEMNDLHGHDAGDRLLIRATEVMIRIFGRNFVFRMGGDEFVMIIQHATEQQVDEQMKRLREEFERSGVSVALGCVWRTNRFEDVDELLKEADRRMYVNKKRMHAAKRK